MKGEKLRLDPIHNKSTSSFMQTGLFMPLRSSLFPRHFSEVSGEYLHHTKVWNKCLNFRPISRSAVRDWTVLCSWGASRWCCCSCWGSLHWPQVRKPSRHLRHTLPNAADAGLVEIASYLFSFGCFRQKWENIPSHREAALFHPRQWMMAHRINVNYVSVL